MLRKKRGPLTYHMCNQAVTVYHHEKDKITRTVFNKAFMEFKKTQNVDNTGSREVNSFLLVVPTDTPVLHVGDKVFMGVGPYITLEEWSGFIPAKVRGLVVIAYVDDKYYGTDMVHQEAGG